ncbi:hypothetical protein HMSSN036_70850 [Paenibacillus macerans]|nr:hypothetical protein HMSSN036_70850 [Paenibacillus macerans]
MFADEMSSTSTGTSQTISSTTSLFSDVANGFWAEKHIYKLAAEGIILGDAGKFRPGDIVTQQEAITMAIRLMNLESQLGNGSKVPADLKVGNYFKPYLELALSKICWIRTKKSPQRRTKNPGARKSDARVGCQILVRALGKDAEAKASATLSTGFADQSSISVNARGYVNVAAQLKICDRG